MKRTFLVVAGFVALLAAPAFAEWRFDVGIDALTGMTVFYKGDSYDADFAGSNIGVIPLPMGEAAYEFELGPARLGLGMRGLTVIVASIFWPDVFAELDLGPVALEGHLGGLLAIYSVVGSGGGVETGNVVVPDLSAWFKLGKMFRLGAGFVGIMAPEALTDALIGFWYLGGKFVIRP